jgi:DNA-binding CsgD family transcriptional regulator
MNRVRPAAGSPPASRVDGCGAQTVCARMRSGHLCTAPKQNATRSLPDSPRHQPGARLAAGPLRAIVSVDLFFDVSAQWERRSRRAPADHTVGARCTPTVGSGVADDEIAAVLGISEGTVNSYLAYLFEKLGVTSRSEAVMAATRRGLALDRMCRTPRMSTTAHS